MRLNTQRGLSLLLAIAVTAPLAAQDIATPMALDLSDTSRQTEVEQKIDDDFELVIETIRERFPDGQIKLLREVARTVELNYVNHGRYTMWNEDGNVTASGQFNAGRRMGKWTRTYQADESPLFSQEPFKRFEAPFLSETTFEDGRLHGTWTIADGLGRKISEITFNKGIRDGKLVYLFPNGKVAREVDYQEGNVHGMDRTFDEEGNILSEYKYVDGRRHALKSTFYLGSKGKKQEIYYLHPQTRVVDSDDWWNATIASQETGDDQPIRHGRYEAWHVNGQKSVSGEYRYGQPHGQFSWWHANGQSYIRGAFVDGKHTGMWHWWHANGMKKSEGGYQQGQPIGRWLTWDDNGQLAKIKKYDQEEKPSDVAEVEAPAVDTNSAAADANAPQLLRVRSARDGQTDARR